MDKITYLAELAEGLARWVPERDRQDILRYYAEYFDEAGIEREAEVVAELGDPWALSCRLAVEGGFVTQEAANAWTPPKKRRLRSYEVAAIAAIGAIVLVATIFSFASGVGRLVGRVVDRALSQVTVTDKAVYAESEAWENAPNVAYAWEGGYLWEGGDMLGGFWSMEDGYLNPFYAIDADISMGNITITDGEDYTLAIQQDGNLGGYRVEWEIQGDTLKIRDSSSGGYDISVDEMGNLFGRRALDVIITVPEGEFLQRVKAETDFGNIFLGDLDVEVKVTAKTKMGNVEGYNIRTSEKIELKTDMGNVTLGLDEPCVGMDIDLKTNLGDVEVSLDCYEWDCAYELETDLGDVTINGVDQGGSVKRKGDSLVKLDAESDLGNVDVYFLDSQWG